MDNILDTEENLNDRKNSSWKPVLIINGVFFMLIVILVMWYFLSDEYTFTSEFIFPEGVFISLLLASICVALINLLATLGLLLSSDKQWKKYFVMLLSTIDLCGIIYIFLVFS
ncbi:hypothetical protein [Bernardetia sp.]|uniref:hypothetical protein n=1 Tax=Bernardetia sp. TaxID=1937974 RepID=UPI0025C3C4B2|nr:hypothetical protein [Bernardetia sp.]